MLFLVAGVLAVGAEVLAVGADALAVGVAALAVGADVRAVGWLLALETLRAEVGAGGKALLVPEMVERSPFARDAPVWG